MITMNALSWHPVLYDDVLHHIPCTGSVMPQFCLKQAKPQFHQEIASKGKLSRMHLHSPFQQFYKMPTNWLWFFREFNKSPSNPKWLVCDCSKRLVYSFIYLCPFQWWFAWYAPCLWLFKEICKNVLGSLSTTVARYRAKLGLIR